MVVEERVSEAGMERTLVERSFRDFLPYIKILDPPPGGGIVDFKLWPHLLTMADAFEQFNLIVHVKPKQVGASWEAAALGLWEALYHLGATVPLYSKGELESKTLLAKCKFIYDHLPPYLQAPLKDGGSVQELVFPSMDSRVLALPSTEAAGIGLTASRVIMDEADFFKYLQENFDTAAKPTVDAGGMLYMLSTINPATSISPFKTIVREAGNRQPGQNGFTRFFFPYNVRPGRDQDWYDAGYAAALDKATYLKNYPRTLEEALAPSQVLAAFDLDALDGMQLETKDPIRTHGTINIYQEFIVGHRYAAFSDPAKGVGKDDAVTVMLDCNTGGFVADICADNISVQQLAFDSVTLMHMFEDPLWGIEDNDWGKMVIDKAQTLEYPNLYERSKDNVGWHTGEHNRFMLWGELMEAVLTRSVTVYSKIGLAQFVNVIKNPDKNGRIEGMEGTHDDYPFACGGAKQMAKHVYDNRIITTYSLRPV
jgi:hypothetical protein